MLRVIILSVSDDSMVVVLDLPARLIKPKMHLCKVYAYDDAPGIPMEKRCRMFKERRRDGFGCHWLIGNSGLLFVVSCKG